MKVRKKISEVMVISCEKIMPCLLYTSDAADE